MVASLVRPLQKDDSRPSVRRVCTTIAAVALFACACILVNRLSPGELEESSKHINRPGLAELKFGDASFHAAASPLAKEGSVRKGVRPDFVPPIGSLGDVGLHGSVSPQALAIKQAKSRSPIALPRLAFGDSTFHPTTATPESREGSVRKGVKPDFKKPLVSVPKGVRYLVASILG